MQTRFRSANSFGNMTNPVSAITFKYYLDFWDICLSCYSHKSARFYGIVDELCASQKFLTSPTNCPIRFLIRPINFPKINKICITEWLEFFCELFSSIFPTCFQTISRQRSTVGSIEMTILLKLCELKTRLFCCKGIERMLINGIVQHVIALWYNTRVQYTLHIEHHSFTIVDI